MESLHPNCWSNTTDLVIIIGRPLYHKGIHGAGTGCREVVGAGGGGGVGGGVSQVQSKQSAAKLSSPVAAQSVRAPPVGSTGTHDLLLTLF